MLLELKTHCEVIMQDMKDFNKKVDIVFQNPPFGVQSAHADKIFLETAFKFSDIIYTFHKIESKNFIDKISADNGFKTTHFFNFKFPLKNTQAYHTRKIHRIDVGCWRLERLKT